MKKYTKVEIAEKLKNDDRWLLRGLVAIYKRQTEDEKKVRETRHNNAQGFSAPDAAFLSSCAQLTMKGHELFPNKLQEVRRRMVKYSSQLAKISNGQI